MKVWRWPKAIKITQKKISKNSPGWSRRFPFSISYGYQLYWQASPVAGSYRSCCAAR
jgi:hypothetical protein